jgi:hypothetical protein
LSAASSRRDPLRVRPELFAGGAVVAGALTGPGGQVAGRRKHRDVRADLGDDDLGAAALHAGDAAQQSDRRLERGDALLDRVREPLDRLVQEVQVGEDRADQQRVQVAKAPLERFTQRGHLLPQPALANSTRSLGSVLPARSASSIARPQAPSRSDATQSSLTSVSSSALCNRWASRWRSSICVLRYRVS